MASTRNEHEFFVPLGGHIARMSKDSHDIQGRLSETLEALQSVKVTERGPASKPVQRLARTSQLPKPKQRFVAERFNTTLAQQTR